MKKNSKKKDNKKKEVMCTIGRTPVGTGGKARHQPDAKECTVRREQGRTDYGSKRGRNSFLSTALTPLAQKILP